MGLGGGFVATIYDKSKENVETMIARERAPLASHKNMFENVTIVEGIQSVAVPGELKGYGEMYKKYGRVPWKTLIQPTIDLCRSGHLVTEYLRHVLEIKEKQIHNSPSLTEVFVNPKTKNIWNVGDRIKRIKLAETLEIVANEGPDTLYTSNGTIVNALVSEMKELGGIITVDDFVQYTVEWKKPVAATINGKYKVYSTPLPASGSILSLILNILNGYKASMSTDYIHRMTESFKYGYAKRSWLGDDYINESFIDQFSDMQYADEIRSLIWDNQTFNDYQHYGGEYELPEDHGTAHLNVLSANGDAVSVTSTINSM